MLFIMLIGRCQTEVNLCPEMNSWYCTDVRDGHNYDESDHVKITRLTCRLT